MSRTDAKPKRDNHKALPRAKEQIKILEESLHRQSKDLEGANKKIRQLEKENSKLKKELQAKRKPPKWAKANKNRNKDGSKRQGKKRGPKKGHKPNPRKRPDEDEVDQEVTWTPLICPDCDTNLPAPHKWHTHHQIDLPPPNKTITTKHIIGWSWCSECKKERSVSDKLASTLYGPRLHAQVSYWKFDLGLTFGKIQKLLRDQFNLDVSRGILSEMISRTAKKFESAYEDIKTLLLEQDYLHADETGWRVDGNNHWLWSFSSDNISFYKIDPTRSQDVVENVLGEVFQGVLITDFYAAYNKIECTKQKCWPHLLRELHELKKEHPKSQELKQFAAKAKRFFNRSKKLQIDYQAQKNISTRYKRLLTDTDCWISKKYRQPDIKRLCKRLFKYRNEIYTFIKTGVDPTNNAGEREIRPAVLLRKISYCNRSDRGAHNQEVMMSMMRTSVKQGISFVEMAEDYLTTH